MHKRTKATSIPAKVKRIVYERDGGCCIICGASGYPEAHIIRRSRGGLGIAENIVTLCRVCHGHYDNNGIGTEAIMAYIKGKYPNWNSDKMTYRKGE